MFVRPFVSNASGLFQVSLRSLLGLSQVSHRTLLGLSQVSLGSFTWLSLFGLSQVSFRSEVSLCSFSQFSDYTWQNGRCLKYFVLFSFNFQLICHILLFVPIQVRESKSSYDGTKAQIYALALGPFPSQSPLPVPQSAPITSSINDQSVRDRISGYTDPHLKEKPTFHQ